MKVSCMTIPFSFRGPLAYGLGTEVIVLLDELQKISFPSYLNWYREHLPDWLDDVAKILWMTHGR